MMNNYGINASFPPWSFNDEKPIRATIAPSLPDAAEIPWQVDLYRVGKTSPGTMKVVEFGPKLVKNWMRVYTKKEQGSWIILDLIEGTSKYKE